MKTSFIFTADELNVLLSGYSGKASFLQKMLFADKTQFEKAEQVIKTLITKGVMNENKAVEPLLDFLFKSISGCLEIAESKGKYTIMCRDLDVKIEHYRKDSNMYKITPVQRNNNERND